MNNINQKSHLSMFLLHVWTLYLTGFASSVFTFRKSKWKWAGKPGVVFKYQRENEGHLHLMQTMIFQMMALKSILFLFPFPSTQRSPWIFITSSRIMYPVTTSVFFGLCFGISTLCMKYWLRFSTMGKCLDFVQADKNECYQDLTVTAHSSLLFVIPIKIFR